MPREDRGYRGRKLERGLGTLEYAIKEAGDKRYLVFDFRGSNLEATISTDRQTMAQVIKALQEFNVDEIVLSDVYERVYDSEQARMLKEIADLASKFAIETPWAYSNLSIEGYDDRNIGFKHDKIAEITQATILSDPIKAYFDLVKEISLNEDRQKTSQGKEAEAGQKYLGILNYIRKAFEKTSLIQKVRAVIEKLDSLPSTSQFYRAFFEAQIKPAFVSSRLLEQPSEAFELVDSYSVLDSEIQIYKHPDKLEYYYFVSPPEYSLTPEKYYVLEKTKELMSKNIPKGVALSSAESTRKYFERVYESTILDIAKKDNIALEPEDIPILANLTARYTVGYGILEILLSDKKITDVYVDSPLGTKPIYLVHSDFGQCQTNIVYTEEEAKIVASKLRAMSSRPFDEAHPVLDYDLQDLDTRVAMIGQPMSSDGTAFAFRLHKPTPWTLSQFLDKKAFPAFAAGFLSFMVDNKASIMVTGSRGSGKTSLMAALMLEINQNIRIIVQEDTQELPIPYMKKIGFNIQRLKTKSPLSAEEESIEVPPENALRTALRLGDSAIVVGEVRSKEAKVLYEAMRVGAAGNTVMGTIHGDSAYSVWDRVVNDLGVPTTSFKATDLVTVQNPIRFKGSLRPARRLTQLTEVKKFWREDPQAEQGLLDLFLYSAKKDNLEFLEDNLKKSDLFSRISNNTGLSINDMMNQIKLLGKTKQYLTDKSREFEIPDLMEAENSVKAHSKLLLMKENQLAEIGAINYEELYSEWTKYVDDFLIKRLIKLKPRGAETRRAKNY